MDIIGIKKVITKIEDYDHRANVELSLGEWGDPELFWFLQAEAMDKLLRMCRGNRRLRTKLMRKYSYSY